MPNQLIHETSPYLLQHADNPVEWYPWGDEALQRARNENKPILLSIGYAACHWCHVMAHESFEDEKTAEMMNALFVNIKVDREERPDLDDIYMQAVVAMTGQGGWPMTVFLTPEGKPFYGGTYYPKEPRFGMPAFEQVLLSIAAAWQDRQAEVQSSATEITSHIQRTLDIKGGSHALEAGIFTYAASVLSQRFDATWGGFSKAPKFPQPMVLEFLLREYLRDSNEDTLAMVEFTLEKMAGGGLYDQIGGGFARYSTDKRWLAPHFEKMLYDNAQLARVYLHAWQITGKPLYRRIVEETLDYILREMQHEGGGFYSSQDADSEGVEGKFYVWSAEEIREALGEDAELFMRIYGVSENGNWEGHNILHIPGAVSEITEAEGATLDEARDKLYAIRAERVWPGLDDKVLTAWNGLMLAAIAEAGRALKREDYIAAATKNATFLYNTMRKADARLYRTWKAGSQPKYNAYLEDYAFLADGLLALYQTTFETRWFSWASELAEHMPRHFKDEERSGFFDTSDDHEDLIHRPKDLEDNATPSGNAMAAQVLFKLSLYSGDSDARQTAEEAVQAMVDLMRQYPFGFGEWLNTAQLIYSQPLEIALIGDGEVLEPLLRVVSDGYRPDIIVAAGEESTNNAIPLLAERPQIEGKATAYVCRSFVCDQPTSDPETLRQQIER